MNFEEWYAKLGEWAEENTALNMSYAMQRHLARHLEAWEASRPTPRALDKCQHCNGAGVLMTAIDEAAQQSVQRACDHTCKNCGRQMELVCLSSCGT